MGADRTVISEPDIPDSERAGRWAVVLGHLVSALPHRGRLILVDGLDQRAALLADRLAERLRDGGHPCVRLTADTRLGDEGGGSRQLTAGAVVIADGTRWHDRVPAGA